ncbi:hypothetical protein [Caballeronia sp. TF1N1]|uniref:hypothetical protein n=1 Tax=Caballeronia sp. TF1N1 TaxID=2878153 RepID=UPI001FD27B30|nr:hypothetical protein [Caballeronia sp. TF1N1]
MNLDAKSARLSAIVPLGNGAHHTLTLDGNVLSALCLSTKARICTWKRSVLKSLHHEGTLENPYQLFLALPNF